MITTNDAKVAETARMFRNHGAERRYYHKTIGYNYRMNEVQAAIGIEQLKKLERLNEKRIENARLLTESLRGLNSLITPRVLDKRKHVFHVYTLRAKGFPRDKIVSELNKAGIESLVYYPIPVHRQEAYKGMFDVGLPVTEQVSKDVFSIPVHPGLEERDLEKIISKLRDILS